VVARAATAAGCFTAEPALPNPSESIDSVLAKNLVVARVITGTTQQGLAERADISRATIAQIETGYSDPRLSTISELAHALGIPLIFLLIGDEEVRAISGLLSESADGALNPPNTVRVSPVELDRMQRLLRSGMLKDRVRAAQIGASLAKAAGGLGLSAEVCAAIFSAIVPGSGTVAGAILGESLPDANRKDLP
jgi:transcriptional regulator with XRE-family HTH domain